MVAALEMIRKREKISLMAQYSKKLQLKTKKKTGQVPL